MIMPENTEIKILENKLKELIKFNDTINDFDLDQFKNLLEEISSHLTKSYKIKFESLKFYEIVEDSQSSLTEDDLPF